MVYNLNKREKNTIIKKHEMPPNPWSVLEKSTEINLFVSEIPFCNSLQAFSPIQNFKLYILTFFIIYFISPDNACVNFLQTVLTHRRKHNKSVITPDWLYFSSGIWRHLYHTTHYYASLVGSVLTKKTIMARLEYPKYKK